MEYTPPVDNLLVAVTYGSHLYGTNTPTSDHDFKAVYLPSMRDLMLAKAPRVLRFRFDEDGNTVGEHDTMPANGYEAEHTPVQKFVHDWLGGQAYAVETVFAVIQGAHQKHMPPVGTLGSRRACSFEAFCHKLAKQYVHRNVNGMVGFAVKQTFDYVRRGERLNAAKKVLDVLKSTLSFHTANGESQPSLVRLDTPVSYMVEVDGTPATHEHRVSEADHGLKLVTETIFDGVVRETGLEVGSTVNHNKTMRTLKLNGREYLETTTLPHLIAAVEKLCDQYGERSTRASETDVDWKSLSHAVRVYQQVIELLETGFVTFPRQNADNLLKIRKGEHSLESVKDLLRDLDDQTNDLLAVTTLPEVTEEFRSEVDDVLYAWLQTQY